MKTTKILLSGLISGLAFTSCTNDDTVIPENNNNTIEETLKDENCKMTFIEIDKDFLNSVETVKTLYFYSLDSNHTFYKYKISNDTLSLKIGHSDVQPCGFDGSSSKEYTHYFKISADKSCLSFLQTEAVITVPDYFNNFTELDGEMITFYPPPSIAYTYIINDTSNIEIQEYIENEKLVGRLIPQNFPNNVSYNEHIENYLLFFDIDFTDENQMLP